MLTQQHADKNFSRLIVATRTQGIQYSYADLFLMIGEAIREHDKAGMAFLLTQVFAEISEEIAEGLEQKEIIVARFRDHFIAGTRAGNRMGVAMNMTVASIIMVEAYRRIFFVVEKLDDHGLARFCSPEEHDKMTDFFISSIAGTPVAPLIDKSKLN